MGKTTRRDSRGSGAIENGKTDPSVSTVEKIAKALGVTMAELFTDSEDLREVDSFDKTLMERVALIDGLDKEKQKTIFTYILVMY